MYRVNYYFCCNMATLQMKQCKKCGKEKTICMFYKQAGNKDGHRNSCKKCYMIKRNKKRRQFTCDYCNKYFMSFQRRGMHKYCSRICYSISIRGKVSWHKGKPGSLIGNKNPKWRGDMVGYRALHDWINRKLGKANKCENNRNHKSTRYHWSNISHKYKRELTDWKQLCPSCNCLDRDIRRISP